MCFNNSVTVKMQRIADKYGRKTDIIEIYEDILKEKYGLEQKPDMDNIYHANAFSNIVSPYPIITADDNIQVFEWGMFADWVKHKTASQNPTAEGVVMARKNREAIYNSKAETIFEKPTFKEHIFSQRCLIPSTGYFEYHHPTPKTSVPYYIFLLNDEIFSMAGIYDVWRLNDKNTFITFSMLTTAANEFTAKIHNGGANPFRMPLILHKEDEEKWLNPDLKQKEIENLLQVYPAELMDAYPVNKTIFLKGGIHDKHVLDKEGSGLLF